MEQSIPLPPAAIPARQGFYRVTLASGEKRIAEFKKIRNKATSQTEPAWFEYVSSDPTIEKTPTPLAGVVDYGRASKDDIAQALARELTLDEMAEEAYRKLVDRQSLHGGYRKVEIPQSRQLKVGDCVAVGALENCVVVALHDEGQVVVFSHLALRSSTRRGPADTPPRLAVTARLWTEVLPAAAQAADKPRLGRENTLPQAMNRALESVIYLLVSGNAESSPDYQRDYVWTPEDKQRFLASVFAGRDIGKFVVVSRPYPHRTQMLDGKQRAMTLLELIASRLPFEGVYWHEMDWRDRALVMGRVVPYIELPESATREYLLETFLELNTAGVPQTDEHLAHVRALLAEERARSKKAASR